MSTLPTPSSSSCSSTLPSFKYNGSTRTETLFTSNCVDKVLPTDLTTKKFITGGLMIVILLAVLVSKIRSNRRDHWVEIYFFYPLWYIFLSVLATMLAGAFVYGLAILAS